MVRNVVVVGAGIVGLSTAVAIQQNCPGVKVTIVADKFTRQTTSDGAGGLFVPFAQHNDEKTSDMWAKEGAKYYYDLAFSPEAGKAGINLISGFELQNMKPKRPWLKYMLYCGELSPQILQRFSPYYKYGYIFTTVVVEGPKYLPWLMDRFVSNGGRVVERKVLSLKEFLGEYDIVVNCSGLGSKELANDPDVQPVRGHVVRVSAPWIKHFIHSDDDKYILPSSETIAVGGFKQVGNDDLVPYPEDSRKLLADMEARFPALKGAKVLWDWVGLRPGRSKVRVEPEVMKFDGKPLQVIHNYGHAAFGISLSWGTGIHVSKLVREMMTPSAKL